MGDQANLAFGPEWDELAANSTLSTVFQTTGWYRAWLETVAAAESVVPLVIEVRSDAYLRAAVALQIRSLGKQMILEPLSTPWADYHEAIGIPNDRDAARRLNSAMQELAGAHNWRIVCDNVLPGGLLDCALNASGYKRVRSSTIAVLDLMDRDHMKRILTRKEYTVKWRRLSRLGTVACVHHDTCEAILERLPLFIRMHQEQWKERNDVVAPFEGGTVNKAFEAIVRHLAPVHRICLTELVLDEKPIAMYYGFLDGKAYRAYRTCFSQIHYRLSPGHLMLQRMISDFVAAGLREFDFMRGSYPYKFGYTNRCRYNICIATTNIHSVSSHQSLAGEIS